MWLSQCCQHGNLIHSRVDFLGAGTRDDLGTRTGTMVVNIRRQTKARAPLITSGRLRNT